MLTYNRHIQPWKQREEPAKGGKPWGPDKQAIQKFNSIPNLGLEASDECFKLKKEIVGAKTQIF